MFLCTELKQRVNKKDKLVDLLLYGDDAYNTNINSSIIKCTITFLQSSERFDIPLL